MATAQDIKDFFLAAGWTVGNEDLQRMAAAFRWRLGLQADATPDDFIGWLFRQARGVVIQYEDQQRVIAAESAAGRTWAGE